MGPAFEDLGLGGLTMDDYADDVLTVSEVADRSGNYPSTSWYSRSSVALSSCGVKRSAGSLPSSARR